MLNKTMNSTTTTCVVSDQPTLYVSIVAGVLLIVSEVLGFLNKRNHAPTSITGAVVQGALGAVKALTPPSSPPASLRSASALSSS